MILAGLVLGAIFALLAILACPSSVCGQSEINNRRLTGQI
jgi:hypothetical protein